ncbi:MAG: glycosyltransferase family 4 protein [bacterium]|nr:glycosyltransferase family 4 protein [bacterium]
MVGIKGIPAHYGGMERHVEELSLRLAARGHQVSVYTRPYYTPKNRKNLRGIRLISLPTIRTKHLDAITHTAFATLHAIRNGAEVIHYHGGGASLVSFLPRLLKPSIKVVATFHSLERLHQKWGFFARIMLKLGEWSSVTFPHETIVVSRPLKKYLKKNYGADAMYIPNGIARDFTKKQPAEIISKKFGLVTDEYILTVARLIPPKGIHYLIEAYHQLKTDKKLVIVGGSSYTDEYVTQVREAAANNPNIVFTGFQNGKTLAELYSNAYVFVIPSEVEGLPLSLLEATGFGKRSLASNIPANLEVLKSGKEILGYTFKNKDVADLRTKLQQIIRQPSTSQKLGRAAQKLVFRKFDWKSITSQTEEVYRPVV